MHRSVEWLWLCNKHTSLFFWSHQLYLYWYPWCLADRRQTPWGGLFICVNQMDVFCMNSDYSEDLERVQRPISIFDRKRFSIALTQFANGVVYNTDGSSIMRLPWPKLKYVEEDVLNSIVNTASTPKVQQSQPGSSCERTSWYNQRP